jgi:hypothetical protein
MTELRSGMPAPQFGDECEDQSWFRVRAIPAFMYHLLPPVVRVPQVETTVVDYLTLPFRLLCYAGTSPNQVNRYMEISEFGNSHWHVSFLYCLGETEKNHAKLTVMINWDMHGLL